VVPSINSEETKEEVPRKRVCLEEKGKVIDNSGIRERCPPRYPRPGPDDSRKGAGRCTDVGKATEQRDSMQSRGSPPNKGPGKQTTCREPAREWLRGEDQTQRMEGKENGEQERRGGGGLGHGDLREDRIAHDMPAWAQCHCDGSGRKKSPIKR